MKKPSSKKLTLEDVPKMIESLARATAKGFERMDGRFEKIDQRFEKMDQRFDKMDQRFDKMDQRFDKIEVRVGGVEIGLGSVESRLGKLEVAVEDGFTEVKELLVGHDKRINLLEDKVFVNI